LVHHARPVCTTPGRCSKSYPDMRTPEHPAGGRDRRTTSHANVSEDPLGCRIGATISYVGVRDAWAPPPVEEGATTATGRDPDGTGTGAADEHAAKIIASAATAPIGAAAYVLKTRVGTKGWTAHRPRSVPWISSGDPA
jgi:hypothetical protein